MVVEKDERDSQLEPEQDPFYVIGQISEPAPNLYAPDQQASAISISR
jgi:hypothetical protein